MATTMKGCQVAQSQPEVTEEHETDPSVSQQEEQSDTAEGKVIAD